MKIYCTGHEGTVGKELVRRGAIPLVMDITNAEQVKSVIEETNPELIIHCAAMTDVGYCEEHPKEAFKVNVEGVRNILDWYNGTFIYISTNHVFPGEKNFFYQPSERHRPNPVNIYGLTKYAGEAMCKTSIGNSYVIRSSRLFNYPMMQEDIHFLRNIKIGKEFTNIIKRSFLHVNQFVHSLLWFVDNIEKMPNLLHIAGIDTMSYYQFWVQAARVLGIDEKLILPRNHEIEDYPRPFLGGLNVDKAKKLGMPMFSVIDGLNLVKNGI